MCTKTNRESAVEDAISVKQQKDDMWAVFYKETVLKTFKSSSCAYAYAYDSAQIDARDRGLVATDAPVARQVRHLETGKIYPSIKRASEDLGISVSGIQRVLNGLKETVKDQHFERVK